MTGCGTATGPSATQDPTVDATPKSLAALVLRHMDANPTYAFPGDSAGRVAGLVSTAVWFSGVPGKLPLGGPDVVEVQLLPADSPFADQIRSDLPGETKELGDGSTLHFHVAAARVEDGWDELPGTTTYVDLILERGDDFILVEYHGNSIPLAGDGLTEESLEELIADPLLGLQTSPDLAHEADAITVWHSGSDDDGSVAGPA